MDNIWSRWHCIKTQVCISANQQFNKLATATVLSHYYCPQLVWCFLSYLTARLEFWDRHFRNCEMWNWRRGETSVHTGGDFCHSLNLEQPTQQESEPQEDFKICTVYLEDDYVIIKRFVLQMSFLWLTTRRLHRDESVIIHQIIQTRLCPMTHLILN